jgi:hypothetical protein
VLRFSGTCPEVDRPDMPPIPFEAFGVAEPLTF